MHEEFFDQLKKYDMLSFYSIEKQSVRFLCRHDGYEISTTWKKQGFKSGKRGGHAVGKSLERNLCHNQM